MKFAVSYCKPKYRIFTPLLPLHMVAMAVCTMWKCCSTVFACNLKPRSPSLTTPANFNLTVCYSFVKLQLPRTAILTRKTYPRWRTCGASSSTGMKNKLCSLKAHYCTNVSRAEPVQSNSNLLSLLLYLYICKMYLYTWSSTYDYKKKKNNK